MHFVTAIGVFLFSLGVSTDAFAVDPGPKCEAHKLKTAGAYQFCRMKAESKAVKKGNLPDYTKCEDKFGDKWGQAEWKGAGQCPTNGDQADIDTEVTNQTDLLTILLSGGTPAGCGDGVADPNANEQCDGVDLGGATCLSLGYTLGGTLACTAGCAYDTTMCECWLPPDPNNWQLPATGQTTTYAVDKNDGIPGPVPVPDDGTVQAGAPLSFVDNGDGTITDLNTGLMWEKKGDDGGLHDRDNSYRWRGQGSQETVWDWLDDINAEGGSGFAGYNDWRIPNLKELQSVIDYERYTPAVDPVFYTDCAPGCTVLTCNCTYRAYWSSTTYASYSDSAWTVFFSTGGVGYTAKFGTHGVLAVRGP